MKLLKKLRRRPSVAPRKFVFIHIPKCAGTSMSKYVQYMSQGRYRGVSIPSCRHALELDSPVDLFSALQRSSLELAQHVLLYFLHQGQSQTGGHVRCTERILDAYESEYQFITILRDPVSRWISHYKYHCLIYGNRWIDGRRNDWEKDQRRVLLDFIDSEQGLHFSNTMNLFLSGENPDSESGYEASAGAAARNLRRFSHIGFVDALEPFVEGISKSYGVKEPYPYENKQDNIYTPNSNRFVTPFHSDPAFAAERKTELNELITGDLRDKIMGACKNDIHLYNTAKSL